MFTPTPTEIDALQATWTDKFVRVKPGRPELERFAGKIGKVITVNFNGRALIDFADGAWYDVLASDRFLEVVPPEDAKGKYDATANSAQAIPMRQGP
jgi:hypothetical protein